jgi:hypothetical protein
MHCVDQTGGGESAEQAEDQCVAERRARQRGLAGTGITDGNRRRLPMIPSPPQPAAAQPMAANCAILRYSASVNSNRPQLKQSAMHGLKGEGGTGSQEYRRQTTHGTGGCGRPRQPEQRSVSRP